MTVTYKPRDEEPGYHHVGARGNNKQRIFLNDRDRQLFLLMLDRIAKKHDWHILTYCLMRNHYHLVLRVGDAGMARGMCELNTGYAVAFNGEHGRINHLFGKRYWSERARSDEHLKNVVRYVLQNPRPNAWRMFRTSRRSLQTNDSFSDSSYDASAPRVDAPGANERHAASAASRPDSIA